MPQPRWSLADLVDFEALLADTRARVDERDRLLFARDIRPALAARDEPARRRAGLRLWLDTRRRWAPPDAGARLRQGLRLLRWALFAAMAAAGFALVAGLCAAGGQRVHVIVFVGLTLGVPWSVFIAWLVARVLARRGGVGTAYLVETALAGVERLRGPRAGARLADWRERLLDGRQPRRVFGAVFGGVLQWGGLGFNLGLVLAFVAALLVFDVRFYWEATPRSDALVASAAGVIAAPWAWAWPAAAPGPAAVRASRARYIDGVKRIPGAAGVSAAWWRFLLMTLIVWGVAPRLLLVFVYRWRLRRALAGLDFQASRHRAVWRALTAVQRADVATAAADGALLLDVGGLGLRGADLRGFLLRALRVDPQAEHRVAVLDEAAEAAADAALGQRYAHVVLLVADWSLSPRAAGALQAWVRAAVGPDTPVTWLVVAVVAGAPVPPDSGHLARWTRFIDGLRDPATDIRAYDPAC